MQGQDNRGSNMRKEDYYVESCTVDEAKELITEYHYLGHKGFRQSEGYGLYDSNTNELIGVAVYHGISAPETVVGAFGLGRKEQEGMWELGRLVLKSEYNGGNYGSFLIGKSLRQLKKDRPVRAIISYATSNMHVGYVYQATNWTYCGLTDKKKDFWVGGKIQERGKTKGKDGVWVGRPQRHRYILVDDKELDLKWEKQPYPKANEDLDNCYGCQGEEVIKNRGLGLYYNCPLCQGNMNKVGGETYE